MKVGKLIENLEKLPKSKEIVFSSGSYFGTPCGHDEITIEKTIVKYGMIDTRKTKAVVIYLSIDPDTIEVRKENGE